jgi:predicted kinase
VAGVDERRTQIGEVDASRITDARPSATDLTGRLAGLGDAHPSGTVYAQAKDAKPDTRNDGEPSTSWPDARRAGDSRVGNEGGDRPSRLTDREHAERVDGVRAVLAEAVKAGLTTDRLHTSNERRTVWTADRVALQKQVVNDLYTESSAVPCEGKAILVGGLPGSGKTTVLRDYADVDLSRYLMINPDDVKVELARRGMVPEVEGLSPMEASGLAHEEASLIAKRLAFRAYADGKNVIWDITMSSVDSAQSRITDLHAAGYRDIEGVFVDIPIEVSIRRADARHREGHELYSDGHGLGGRLVAPEAIKAQADDEFGSVNHRSFVQVKPDLDRWRTYDNSVDGRPALLADAGTSPARDTQEAAKWPAR